MAGRPLSFFQVLLVEVGAEALSDSDRNPHRVHLVLESQQAVGNALLVARKTHPDPLDVTVGGEGERGLGTGLCCAGGVGRGREQN